LLNYGEPTDYEWDVVTGISVGSINSSYISAYKVGDEKKAAQGLSDVWANTKTSDIIK
jgi:predicted acylesterase/phospholipase RssA